MSSIIYYWRSGFGIFLWSSILTGFFISISVISSVVVSPDQSYIAATNPDSDSITIINTQSLKVKSEVRVGDDPRNLSFTPDSKNLVVSNHGNITISIVDID